MVWPLYPFLFFFSKTRLMLTAWEGRQATPSSSVIMHCSCSLSCHINLHPWFLVTRLRYSEAIVCPSFVAHKAARACRTVSISHHTLLPLILLPLHLIPVRSFSIPQHLPAVLASALPSSGHRSRSVAARREAGDRSIRR